ncbi:hypothetical protein QCA50_003991 [Cerrena zonata]|uniref:Gluconokinase n=1 Tax=Cerrena zonata TaxID=2478898 RepID=A0AAW0GHX7_9APHY
MAEHNGDGNGLSNTGGAGEQNPMLIIVMGVAGTGKSTIAKALNTVLEMPYVEGDDLHPKSNIDKMSNGQPLTDTDREPWLTLIRTTAENLIAEQQSDPSFTGRQGVMVTCSALKRYYREILRGEKKVDAPSEDVPVEPSKAALSTYFVYIKEEEKLLRDRIEKREGHYMKPNMVDSQLAALESPEGEEGVVVVPMDTTTEEQVRVALAGLKVLAGEL